MSANERGHKRPATTKDNLAAFHAAMAALSYGHMPMAEIELLTEKLDRKERERRKARE
jgi:predicted aconitase